MFYRCAKICEGLAVVFDVSGQLIEPFEAVHLFAVPQPGGNKGAA